MKPAVKFLRSLRAWDVVRKETVIIAEWKCGNQIIAATIGRVRTL